MINTDIMDIDASSKESLIRSFMVAKDPEKLINYFAKDIDCPECPFYEKPKYSWVDPATGTLSWQAWPANCSIKLPGSHASCMAFLKHEFARVKLQKLKDLFE